MEKLFPYRASGHVNDQHITPAPRRPAEKPMLDYRAYIIGPDGHFKASETISATDDAAAIEAAGQFVGEDGVEVWLLDRKVAVLPAKTQK